MDGGWIKLHRKMLKWEWYQDANTKIVFLHLLLKANYEENRWLGNTIEVGEVPTSISAMSKDLGLSVKEIRTAIEHLKQTGEVAIRKANGTARGTSIIKVCNYGLYQCLDDSEGQALRQTDGQAKGQPKGKQGASEGQANGKQRATLKEINNIRNKEIEEEKKKDIRVAQEKPKQPYGEFENVTLTNEEFNKLINEFGTEKTMLAIDYLGSYKLEKPYTTKSDYLTLRRWVFKAVEEREQKRYGGAKKPQTDEDFFGGLINFANGE